MTLLHRGRRRPVVDHHLVAGIPTPNGPLHLGHVGGPFLRLDVLARFQRMTGNRAHLISGTDAYESYVELAACRTGTEPDQIAHRYHRVIAEDLAAVGIVHDAFIDPLDPRWADRYAGWHRQLLDRLRTLGRVERRTTRILQREPGGRYLSGGFLAGRCPDCGAPVVGVSCEECGMWFSTGTITEPRDNLDGGDVAWREVTNLYLRLDPDEARAAAALPDHKRVVDGYLDREGPYWQMTRQGHWGVPGPPDVTAPAVYSTYGLGILAYAALCGEEFGVLSGRGGNALAEGSGVVTVSAHGFDSIVPDVFATPALRLLGPGLRPYDHLTLNRFLLLEGRKFSTSSGHAIGVRAFTSVVDSDLVRHHLARISPDGSSTDFRLDEFVALTNRCVVGGLQARADECWDRAGTPAAPPPLGRLDTFLARQQAALDPGRLDLPGAVAALDDWTGEDGVDAYWWLKGAAVLATAIMPRWARAVWHGLGHDGDPTLGAVTHTPPLADRLPRRHFAPLDPAAVRSAARRG